MRQPINNYKQLLTIKRSRQEDKKSEYTAVTSTNSKNRSAITVSLLDEFSSRFSKESYGLDCKPPSNVLFIKENFHNLYSNNQTVF
jgi:hypothetical protein